MHINTAAALLTNYVTRVRLELGSGQHDADTCGLYDVLVQVPVDPLTER
jgi:hypothetical protein